MSSAPKLVVQLFSFYVAVFHYNLFSSSAIVNYKWDPFVGRNNSVQNSLNDLIHEPIYVSLTTIRGRLSKTLLTVQAILNNDIRPSGVFLFVSREPYLLDKGVSEKDIESSGLADLAEIHPIFKIIFTDNIGPHRKLLPLLWLKWKEDCIIVTVDDHVAYPPDLLSSLINYHLASNKTAVVSLRARRFGLCSDFPPWSLAPYPKKGSLLCTVLRSLFK